MLFVEGENYLIICPVCVLLEQTEVDSLTKKKKKFPAVIFVICAIIIIQAFILVILA